MKLRILLSAVLVTAVALPVIAIATRFPDIPDNHQHADAIRWASDPEQFNGAALFRGFPDGNFGPDQELTENQFVKVVDRLFDSVDRWTRAETAALLYHGFNGLRNGTTTTTTTTTTTRFPDVPDDHQHIDAIRWASDPEDFNGNPLFRGFVDGSFGPDIELTEGQFTKVVDRLFDSVDRWTRAETAALLYHGFNGLRNGTTTTTTTTTTTRPAVIETTPTRPAVRTAPTRPAVRTAPTRPAVRTTPIIQPQTTDTQLQVGIRHDTEGNWGFLWVRPGWKGHGWKWRLHTYDPNCSWNNNKWRKGASGWQIRPGGTYGKANDAGLCIEWGTYDWQIEIAWHSGERFISEPCVRSNTENDWDCPIPDNWTNGWPRPNYEEDKDTYTPQLKVGIWHDEDSNFRIHWLRYGWESQGWKWRLRTADPNCGFTNGVGSWQDGGSGWSNFLFDDGGLCIQRGSFYPSFAFYDWQIEIEWDNGETFKSEPCVRRNNRWDCNTPDWSFWTSYRDIPPEVSFIGTEFYSKSDGILPNHKVILIDGYSYVAPRETNGITSFDVILTTDRDKTFSVIICGSARSAKLIKGVNNRVRVHCPSEPDTIELVVRHPVSTPWQPDTTVLLRYISIPTGTNTNTQKLNPKVEFKIQEGKQGSADFVVVEVIVGNSDLAKRTTATRSIYYSGRVRGYRIVQFYDVDFDDDRFRLRRSLGRISSLPAQYPDVYGTIQLNEPGAPTHHLSWECTNKVCSAWTQGLTTTSTTTTTTSTTSTTTTTTQQ